MMLCSLLVRNGLQNSPSQFDEQTSQDETAESDDEDREVSFIFSQLKQINLH